jgi:hypothetical protein
MENEADSNSANDPGDFPTTNPDLPKKESGAVYDRRSVVFGPGDDKMLRDLVKVGYYNEWPAINRSTLIRALIRIAHSAYAGHVFPVNQSPWALYLHDQMPIELRKIRSDGAPRGPKTKTEGID